jgi:hypothetical protein
MKAKDDLTKRLEKLLNQLALPQSITVSDIEDIVWNESNTTDFSRLIGMFIEGQTDINKTNEIMEIIQEAWNTYPHKNLGGKSPKQMVEEYRESGSNHKLPLTPVVSSRKRKTLSEVFGETYPETVQLVKIGKIEWGFEYPQLYHRLTEQLWELEESDCTARQYENKLKGMLESMPELFDAANNLAQFYGYNENYRSVKRVYEVAVALARSYIPPEFVPGKHHIIWAYLDNRPFLRLLNDYAQFIEVNDKISRAIPLYEEILSYNPNDNQGVRYVLATAYLKTNQPEKVIELASHYPHEIGPDLVMGKVLALLKLGETEQASNYFKRNKKYQMHVVKELLKSSHPRPKKIEEDRITVGGDDEAWYYWQQQGALWETTKGAKNFLREACSRQGKR